MPFGNNPITGRPGPAPKPPRDGDKVQARQRINVEVLTGRRPHPNNMPCVDCGHVWADGERRHEYDHHLGYGAEHQMDVVARCTSCHHKKDNAKAARTHCAYGHEFNEVNTITAKNGTRHCRECHRAHDRKRGRDADFWRDYRRKKKECKDG